MLQTPPAFAPALPPFRGERDAIGYFEVYPLGVPFTARIDESEGVSYKPRQSRDRAADGCLPGTLLVIALGAQRRKSRETNLSAEQIGAQAPARFSRAHGDQGRPKGSGGTAYARAQAPQCVNGNAAPPSSSG